MRTRRSCRYTHLNFAGGTYFRTHFLYLPDRDVHPFLIMQSLIMSVD